MWFVLSVGLSCLVSPSFAKPRPDVLFVAIDDMNDWISLLDPESPIRTPNLERLAKRGTLFKRPIARRLPAILPAWRP